ncbi:EF-hand calcium-binding domain-containing protein 1-like [Actinia tenebrosa]|uniref:EF-hand calcium-binding domain-containing protein 1-like n=1 Tax=Actinia tenebrosa TaxID=6105 RepID=A0A6P8J0F0_ACTTE|nr:EF-hand calcium-binding domain-containing protein 1-like [Actinia tenebrosa]
MNLKVIFILCLVAVLLFPDAEGWWRRRRSSRRRQSCNWHCYPKCHGYECKYKNGAISCYKLCKTVCSTVCSGKREVPAEEVPGDEEDPAKKPSSRKMKLIPLPLPDKFSDYDSNNDGQISYEEFKKALPHVKDNTAIRKGFHFIDRNGDSHIDCKEFLKSQLNAHKAEVC